MKIGDIVELSFKNNWEIPIICKVKSFQEETEFYYGIDEKGNTRCLGKEGNPLVKVTESNKQLTLF